jgi:hypothetical protein
MGPYISIRVSRLRASFRKQQGMVWVVEGCAPRKVAWTTKADAYFLSMCNTEQTNYW